MHFALHAGTLYACSIWHTCELSSLLFVLVLLVFNDYYYHHFIVLYASHGITHPFTMQTNVSSHYAPNMICLCHMYSNM